MALDFTSGAGHLFNRLGTIFFGIEQTQTFQGATIPAINTDIEAQFTTRGDIVPNLQTNISSGQSAPQGLTGNLSAMAGNTLVTMVQEDAPQPSATVAGVLPELIFQMNAAGASVVKNTVTGTATASTLNTGTGACIISVVDPTGLAMESILAEVFQITCTADSLPGQGATAGQERFSIQGTPTVSKLAYNWPGGSGGNTQITVSSSDVSGSTQNALTNSNFESWTNTNTANSWTAAIGTFGTTIKQTTSSYTGTYALCIVGNGSELTRLTQPLRDTSVPTPGIITPQTKYVLAFRSRVSAVPSAGVLRVALKDTAGGSVVGGGGVTVTLSGETTSYALHSVVFNTPIVFPNILTAVIELTTALDNAKSVFVDELVLTAMTQHQKGPFFTLLRGSTNFLRGDVFNITTTNDRLGKFQEFFNRCFDMDTKGLLLPSNGTSSATISNSLIA